MLTTIRVLPIFMLLMLASWSRLGAESVTVHTVDDLVAAVQDGAPGDTIHIAAGEYHLASPLQPKVNMTLIGAGREKTILTAAPGWDPGADSLPEDPTSAAAVDRSAYLIDLGAGREEFADKRDGVTIRDLTVDGDFRLHGGVFAFDTDDLVVKNCLFKSFRWTGVRTFFVKRGAIQECVFENSGRNTESGENPGVIFLVWSELDISHNLIYRTLPDYWSMGIKGRGATNTRIHHNTILTDFSIEFPFENDHSVEIDHNILAGTVSLPGWEGGTIPDSADHSFHIHHNWFWSGYSIEGVRNNLIVEHNLFDTDRGRDLHNLMSCWSFGQVAPGPVVFYNNLIRNPGYGIWWIDGGQNNLTFRNNEVRGAETVSSRSEGLFGLYGAMDYGTVIIRDNIIENTGPQRPLMRNGDSYDAVIENNTLIGIADVDAYDNPDTGAPRGLAEPLDFACGAFAAYRVHNWDVRYAEPGVTTRPTSLLTSQQPHGIETLDESREFGIRLRSSVDGRITHIRYLHVDGETGSHTGRIWSSNGELLASQDFPPSEGSGWRQVALAQPLTIDAGAVYTVSITYHTAYPFAAGGLAAPVINGPLATIQGDNGVLGTAGAFPQRSFYKTNYFIDVVFDWDVDRTITMQVPPYWLWSSASPGAVVYPPSGYQQTVDVVRDQAVKLVPVMDIEAVTADN